MVGSISVLGATGSVGRQTLAVAERLRIPVKAISGNSNLALLEEQARRFRPEFVCVSDENGAKALRTALADTGVRVGGGMHALSDCAAAYADCVVTAVSGSAGLTPTLAAIDAGRRIALANKETLVCAGELVMRRAAERGAEILPVDSEHSAVFQCLEAQGGKRTLKRILLTGSGGPFRGKTPEETRNVAPELAVAHPNWSMGAKISVDSATLMNKGLEFIEAMHLFGVTPDEIRVIIHPESVIHSMVAYSDGCVMAQLGVPDMALPIQYALSYPDRVDSAAAPELDLAALGKLTFFEPELKNAPCLALAMDCARRGGTAAAVMSAANEEAVALFLAGRLCFGAISEIVSAAVAETAAAETISLELLRDADAAARRFVRENCRRY
ncbi:MAG: 1-deoxy-D-xylulose-5-phosphate reductoisomerase [Oscillospiraceae bacterium]|jgi:1-deoxy-D-xylulose-5-phosphate reductoisomerase|nr:1-deoxy-D-xylulose-5-phosphate reductoisomerase [Oscillospiraceae bacterium]